jgi:hypothetical protein
MQFQQVPPHHTFQQRVFLFRTQVRCRSGVSTVMKARWEVEVRIHSILIWTPDGGELYSSESLQPKTKIFCCH